VNIVDTPGHADFGGEVERIMKMIDGVLLVVDAHDGPQAADEVCFEKGAGERREADRRHQTRSIAKNAEPHKVLRPGLRLFLELHANDEQLDFPIVYASAKQGFAKIDLKDREHTMDPLYQTVVTRFRHRKSALSRSSNSCVANLDYSDYLGRLAYGRIVSGQGESRHNLVCLTPTGSLPRRSDRALRPRKA